MKSSRVTPKQIDLAVRLRVAFALVTRAQRQEVRGQLTPVQISALHKIDTFGPLRLGDLAVREHVAGPTMSRVIASLDANGLVRRSTDPTSARCSLVTITPEGRKQLNAVRNDRNDHMSCRVAALTPAHQRLLADALPAIEALVEAFVPGEDWPREMERLQLARGAKAKRGSRPAK